MTIETTYRSERSKGWKADQALRNARIIERWAELDGEFEMLDGRCSCEAPVRLMIEPDCGAYDDSYLDTWDLRESEIEREREALWGRINAEGVWNVVAQVWTGDGYEDVDVVCGFIGDDWQGSGYDIDLMSAAIEAYDERLTIAARALEASRPDMYN